MVTRSRLVGAGLVLLAIPAIGLAAPDGVPGPPEGRGPGTTTNAQPAPPPAAKPAKPIVSVIARGVVKSEVGGGSSITMTVNGRNVHLPKAWTTVTVKIGPKTRITKSGKGVARAADLKVGDRVVAQWRARKGSLTSPEVLAAIEATRITDTGPKPARN